MKNNRILYLLVMGTLSLSLLGSAPSAGNIDELPESPSDSSQQTSTSQRLKKLLSKPQPKPTTNFSRDPEEEEQKNRLQDENNTLENRESRSQIRSLKRGGP